MERKLATIQKIKEISPIEGADAIERATVLGWHLVVKKGEFKPGDWCVYFEVDSVLPQREEFEFLRKGCYNPRLDGFRIKTIKIRGQMSQGLAFPLSILGNKNFSFSEEGEDVTEELNVFKYEAPIPSELSGAVKGNFPYFIPKTDETRIQAMPDLIDRHCGKRFTATEKLDGTSSTFYYNDGEFGFCSRNLKFKPEVDNTFSKVAKSLSIEDKLKSIGKNISIQGEIVGPGIQKNKYKLLSHELFIFNVYDIDAHKYYDYPDYIRFCHSLGLKHVPIISDSFILEHTIDELVEYSNGMSILCETKREGVVFRPYTEEKDYKIGRLSFKVINPDFLLKYEGGEE